MIPKIGPVRIRQSQAVEGAPKSATIKQDACGNWHITLVSEFVVPDAQVPAEKIVGMVAVGHTETENAHGPEVRLPFVEAVGVEVRIPGFSRGECQKNLSSST